MRVALHLLALLALVGGSVAAAAPEVDRFSVQFAVGRKSGIVCAITGGALTLKTGRFLGAAMITAKGDLGGSSLVCTFPDGRKVASQGHLALFQGGSRAADIVLYPPRTGNNWIVQGTVIPPTGPRQVAGNMAFAEVR
jgi:hypothetical protein